MKVAWRPGEVHIWDESNGHSSFPFVILCKIQSSHWTIYKCKTIQRDYQGTKGGVTLEVSQEQAFGCRTRQDQGHKNLCQHNRHLSVSYPYVRWLSGVYAVEVFSQLLCINWKSTAVSAVSLGLSDKADRTGGDAATGQPGRQPASLLQEPRDALAAPENEWRGLSVITD